MPSEKRHRVHPVIRKRARQLRQPQTPAEAKLWNHLRHKQLGDLKFRRQHPIDRFIVDFYCAEHKLVIEIDGDTHAMQEEYDTVRTEWLEEPGYRIIRFTNDEVHQRLPTVLETIMAACEGG